MPANSFAAIRPHVVMANHAAEFIRRYPPLVVAMNHAAEFIRHCLYVIFFGIIQPYCLYIIFKYHILYLRIVFVLRIYLSKISFYNAV